MSTREQLRSTFESRVEELALDAKTLERVQPHVTIDPGAKRSPSSPPALDDLRQLVGSGCAIEAGPTIGEGGMGIVRLARQLVLDRDVALKSVRVEVRNPTTTLKLLREAWITGRLEHPNVIPIHDILLDEDGHPQLVLKRIAGLPWSELMRDAPKLRDRFHVRDALEWNLRTLMQVCSAVHFAHRSGILHRDLKPENVMIGEFGEVYVVDWGIAVALTDDGSGRFPLARDASELAGTPQYMAPEMLGGAPELLSPRTDVYLLGSMLYEVVVGEPPHRGASMMEIFQKVARSEPDIPSSVPSELARIITRAMDADPDARFETAEQLRLALTGFLEHRVSLILCEEALERLGRLEKDCDAPKVDSEEWRERVYRLFGECRFGFLEALRIWRENEEARAGLSRAVTRMIEVELSSNDPRAASRLLSELGEPPEELTARVTRARASFEAEEDRRNTWAREHDPTIGRRTRTMVGVVLGITWTVFPWVAYARERMSPVIDYPTVLLASIGILAFYSVLVIWGRRSLAQTVINRRTMAAIGVVLIAQLVLFTTSYWLGIAFGQAKVLQLVMHMIGVATLMATMEIMLWPSAATFMVVVGAATIWPEIAFPLQSLANLVLTINTAWLGLRIPEAARTW